MELTPTQVQHYDSFGFLIVRDFLQADYVQALRDALTRLKTEQSGESDPLKHTGRVSGMFHTDPLFLEMFDNEKLHGIAKQLLRDEKTVFFGDDYASFSTPADWHPDMLEDTPFEAVKFGFYLDDLSQGGYLNVLPGSHHLDYTQGIIDYRIMEKPAPKIQCAHACMTEPGDLLIFNVRLWHEGTANAPGTHRRVIFWSIGQGHPECHKWARKHHDTFGRGTPDEPWPPLILKDAPQRRLALLDVYEPDMVKHQQLVQSAIF